MCFSDGIIEWLFTRHFIFKYHLCRSNSILRKFRLVGIENFVHLKKILYIIIIMDKTIWLSYNLHKVLSFYHTNPKMFNISQKNNNFHIYKFLHFKL